MIKIIYPNGAIINLNRGKHFIAGERCISIYDDNEKLIASFYKMDGLGVGEVVEENKEDIGNEY